MVEQFQNAMKDMMATMIKQIMEMMANIIQQRQPPPHVPPPRPTEHTDNPNQYSLPNYPANPPTEHSFSTHARNLHQKINNFQRPSGRAGGRGGGRGNHREEASVLRRNLPKGILRQHEQNSTEINYDDEMFWEQPYDSDYERHSGCYEQENNNRPEEPGGYPSTVAPSG